MKASHIVIDIETLDTIPTSPILEIGAAAIVDGKLFASMGVKVQLPERFVCGRETLSWWLRSNTRNLAELLNNRNQRNLIEALSHLASFIHYEGDEKTLIVGNGPSFDLTILENAYRETGLECPFHFRQYRDFRTYKELAAGLFLNEVKKDVAHRAEEDAVSEAKILLVILGFINGLQQN